nr:MAG TPA: hypothetical protein [Inoviridae sp.]
MRVSGGSWQACSHNQKPAIFILRCVTAAG